MSPLVGRSGLYSGWDRARSDRVQSEVHSILLTSNLRAHVIAIDLRAWQRHQPLIQSLRTVPHATRPGATESYADHYFWAFQHSCESIAGDVDRYSGATEVAFAFDQLDQMKERAERLYQNLRQDSSLPFTSKLGNLSFVSSDRNVAVQAADVLAYEAKRQFMSVVFGIAPQQERPVYWQAVSMSPNARIRFITDAQMPGVLKAMS